MQAIALLALVAVVAVHAGDFTPLMTEPTSTTLIGTHNASSLYAVKATGYDDPIYILNLKGASRYECGYDYGILMGNACVANYEALVNAVSNNTIIQDILMWFMDLQYNKYLSVHLPADMIEEFQGFADAGNAIGQPNLGLYMTRGLTLASLATGDVLDDIEYLILDELNITAPLMQSIVSAGWSVKDVANELRRASKNLLGMHCSFFGVWGNRTVDGQLFSGRNLDWDKDTGISKYKVLAVWHIPGKYSYVTVGFAGLSGALTGMSSQGITVHEAGDDNKRETFLGFAWSMRLRYIMENAANLNEATTLWADTLNTLGLNHGIGSAADAKLVALETKAGYTASFLDNDPREAALMSQGQHVGAPVVDAVWRTNHGYDSEFLSTAVHQPTLGSDSTTRYFLLHDTIVLYEAQSLLINASQAVNITAVVGDKGGSSVQSFLTCSAPNSYEGSNIISATFMPAQQQMYVAFENGHAEQHVAASCNYYVHIDMSPYF